MKPAGSLAIGTLLMFVAVLLVIMGGALVLLQTQGLFADQYRANAQEGQRSILLQWQAEHVSADRNAVDATKLSYLYLSGRLGSQSPSVPLNQFQLILQTESASRSLDYNAANGNSDADCRTAASGASVFSMRFPNLSALPIIMQPSDLAEFCVHALPNIGPNTKLLIRVLPKNGTSTTLETRTPASFDRNTLGLFP